MREVKICGRKVPAIGIGTWNMGSSRDTKDLQIATIRSGIEAGARVIDTAEMYGSGDSEILVGKAIKPYPREQMFLISKFLPSNATKSRIEISLDHSLKNLQTDYLDLYLYHWRGITPLLETVTALQHLQDSGKIRAWGVSNFDTADLEELWQLPNGKNVQANEDLYNLANRGIDFDLIPWQKDHHLPLIAYSPVGSGTAASHGKNIKSDPQVQAIAQKYKVSSYQIMLAWVIRNGFTIAIPQTNNPKHMKDNIAAAKIKLTASDLMLLDQAFPAPTKKQILAKL